VPLWQWQGPGSARPKRHTIGVLDRKLRCGEHVDCGLQHRPAHSYDRIRVARWNKTTLRLGGSHQSYDDATVVLRHVDPHFPATQRELESGPFQQRFRTQLNPLFCVLFQSCHRFELTPREEHQEQPVLLKCDCLAGELAESFLRWSGIVRGVLILVHERKDAHGLPSWQLTLALPPGAFGEPPSGGARHGTRQPAQTRLHTVAKTNVVSGCLTLPMVETGISQPAEIVRIARDQLRVGKGSVRICPPRPFLPEATKMTAS